MYFASNSPKTIIISIKLNWIQFSTFDSDIRMYCVYFYQPSLTPRASHSTKTKQKTHFAFNQITCCGIRLAIFHSTQNTTINFILFHSHAHMKIKFNLDKSSIHGRCHAYPFHISFSHSLFFLSLHIIIYRPFRALIPMVSRWSCKTTRLQLKWQFHFNLMS